MKFMKSMSHLFNALVLVLFAALLLPGTLLSTTQDTGDHPFLGVSVRNMKHAEKKQNRISHGVMVIHVDRDSSAASAGMKEGDIIRKLGDTEIFAPRDLVDAVRSLKIGSKVNVRITRDKKNLSLNAVLGRAPEHQSMLPRKFSMFKGKPRPWIGVSLHDMNDELAAYFGVSQKNGVLVLSLEKESPAAGGGMKSGDVIHEVDGEKVRTAADIKRIVMELTPGSQIDFQITRHKKRMKISVTVGKKSREKGWHLFRNWHRNWDPDKEVDIYVTPDDEVQSGTRILKKKGEKLRLNSNSPHLRWIEERSSRKETLFI